MSTFNCPKCGNPVNASQKFCSHCGNIIDGSAAGFQTIKATYSEEPSAKDNKIGIAGIILGIFFIIVGIVRIIVTLASSATFGADFYTDIYDAALKIGVTLGWILIAIGVMLILFTHTRENKNIIVNNTIESIKNDVVDEELPEL